MQFGKHPVRLLQHMRNEVILNKLISYSGKLMGCCRGLTYEQFISDTKLVEASVFNLSQMGEPAN